jgi:hypothetical protein
VIHPRKSSLILLNNSTATRIGTGPSTLFIYRCKKLAIPETIKRGWIDCKNELAHLALHLSIDEEARFFDDLDAADSSQFEAEADAFASECLIPVDWWKKRSLGVRLNFYRALKSVKLLPGAY